MLLLLLRLFVCFCSAAAAVLLNACCTSVWLILSELLVSLAGLQRLKQVLALAYIAVPLVQALVKVLLVVVAAVRHRLLLVCIALLCCCCRFCLTRSASK
jgi:hypothetical protein